MTLGDLSWIFFLCSPKQEVRASRVIWMMISPKLVLAVWPVEDSLFRGTLVAKRSSSSSWLYGFLLVSPFMRWEECHLSYRVVVSGVQITSKIECITLLFPEPYLLYPWGHLALRGAPLCIKCSSQNLDIILACSPPITTFYQLSKRVSYVWSSCSCLSLW